MQRYAFKNYRNPTKSEKYIKNQATFKVKLKKYEKFAFFILFIFFREKYSFMHILIIFHILTFNIDIKRKKSFVHWEKQKTLLSPENFLKHALE